MERLSLEARLPRWHFELNMESWQLLRRRSGPTARADEGHRGPWLTLRRGEVTVVQYARNLAG